MNRTCARTGECCPEQCLGGCIRDLNHNNNDDFVDIGIRPIINHLNNNDIIVDTNHNNDTNNNADNDDDDDGDGHYPNSYQNPIQKISISVMDGKNCCCSKLVISYSKIFDPCFY